MDPKGFNATHGGNGRKRFCMQPYCPSIFNDVIGPVMRGPSSSHCAAAVRIGRLAKDLMDGRIDEVRVVFDSTGSLAATHESQGSDMGLLGGFLGWEPDDERLLASAKAIKDAGIRVFFGIKSLGATHPNTYHLWLKGGKEVHEMVALSTGGGMVEIVRIDGTQVSMAGDYFETLLFIKSPGQDLMEWIKNRVQGDDIRLWEGKNTRFIEIKTQQKLDEKALSELRSRDGVLSVKELSPVLPILSRKNMEVPFITHEQMEAYNEHRNLALWELALEYESRRGNIPKEDVIEKMRGIVQVLQNSILKGIQGTVYKDRMLGHQSGFFKTHMEDKKLLDAGILNPMILYVTAMMEVKSSMGVIVAAPTAGACGVIPGACLGAAGAMGLSEHEVIRAMLAAGMIGVLISAHSTFAAEVGGCQAECGAGSGMAAAALVTLAGGNTRQAVAAASMALQNVFGMVCDPVAGRVEVPCLGRNVLAVGNALGCANMALADYDPVIPLDEVIHAMDRVGRSLPQELRCTARGGLSLTRTAKELERRLQKREMT
jgi:L-serine dehydratase